MTGRIPDLGEISPEATVAVWFARVEAKLDVAIAQHAARLDEHARRIGELESGGRVLDTRLRDVEQRPTVTPRAMWTGVGTAGGLVGLFLTLADRLYS